MPWNFQSMAVYTDGQNGCFHGITAINKMVYYIRKNLNMKIAFFGSYREKNISLKAETSLRKDFEEACFEIGYRMVQDGHQIIIGSDSKNTADYHVFRGAFEFLKNNRINKSGHYIEVVRPHSHVQPYIEYYKEIPDVFAYQTRDMDWESAHLVSIKESDLIITICGAEGTYVAGMATLVAGKKLFPIGSFGGASSKLLMEIPKFNVNYLTISNSNFLFNPWNKTILDKLIDISKINAPPEILIIHGRSQDNQLLKNYLTSNLNIPITNVKIMGETYGTGKSLPEKFEELATTADCAIALATPDDFGNDKSNYHSLNLRARQNVWLEIGWFWGKLGRDKVLILVQDKIEIPSDLSGLEFYNYQSVPMERAEDLRRFIGKIKKKA